jgi:hypothetical protein
MSSEDRFPPAEGESIGVATEPLPPHAARPRWNPWAIFGISALVTLLLLGAIGGGVAAWQSYDAGAAWRARAAAEAERADAAERLLAAERERTEALEARIGGLESEVAELEERVVALAGEKAGAEDEALLAQETVERLAALSRFATETGASLRGCIALSIELTNDIVAAVNAGTLDPEATNTRIAEVDAVCGDAQDAYEDLRQRVDALSS